MLKLLFFIILFFLLVRYINRMFLPSGRQQKNTRHFSNKQPGNRRNKFDDIEEAEYEDLSNQDN